MSNTQSYSKADAENILKTANNYVSDASKSAHIANKYIKLYNEIIDESN